ncbi:hypothetical protein GSS87_04945 [Corynebacterium sp. 4HC-13]|uniref:hypothetical protein n=1 Tax=Corynebacterium anserum TaxID=2684406 RepID=UPI00163B328E|nr:hypothetical protein [Corynebacterium anserum]MBC2681746.1 hypothetical protein [Corynebacterium anserum]
MMNQVPASPNPSSNQRPLSRRRFFGTLGLSAAALSLSACGRGSETSMFDSLTQRKPNGDVVRIYAEYQHLAKSGGLNRYQQPFIEGQMELINDEWHRLCGTDSDGNQPRACVDPANAQDIRINPEFTAKDLQEDLLAVASGVAKKKVDSPDVGLLVGLASALGAITAAPQAQDLSELAPQSITEEIKRIHSTVQGVIFACGIAAAVDDGTYRATILSTANALRELRNSIEEAADGLNVDLDSAPAGWVPTDGEKLPSIPSEVMPYMQKITHTVVNALYLGATQAHSKDNTRYCATWCAAIALQEIAQERAITTNPLLKLVRGNATENRK